MRPVDRVVAHVDGSCRNNGHQNAKAGFGLLIKIDDHRVATVSSPIYASEVESTPNSNLAELSAALFALEFGKELCAVLHSEDLPPPEILTIFSDSEYVEKGFSGESQTYSFPEMWSEMQSCTSVLSEYGVHVTIEPERAHVGNPGNEEADNLAKRASGALRNPSREVVPLIFCQMKNCHRPKTMRTPRDIAIHWKDYHLPRILNGFGSNFSCDICDFRAKSYRALQHHMQANHEQFVCDYCDDSFASREEVRHHIFYCHGADSDSDDAELDCPWCGHSFQDLEDLQAHVSEEHSMENYGNQFECLICEETLPNEEALTEHYDEHRAFLGNDMRWCSDCNIIFDNTHEIMHHFLEVHTGEDDIEGNCYICLGYDSWSAFGRSQRYDDNEDSKSDNDDDDDDDDDDSMVNYSYCAMCEEIFLQRSSYVEHMREWHGIFLPFDAQSETTSRHTMGTDISGIDQLLNEISDFESNFGDETASFQSDFAAHQDLIVAMHEVDHENKWEECSNCSEIFSSRSDMSRHKAYAHNQSDNEEDFFFCGDCELYFADADDWNAHFYSQHSDDNENYYSSE